MAKPGDDVFTQQEWMALGQYALANGFTAEDLDLLGTDVNGRSRIQLSADVREILKTFEITGA